METQAPPRKPYPTNVRDDEWAFAVPDLSLMTEDAPQRVHDLREVFNALRWIVHTGAPGAMCRAIFPPWEAVYQQTRRWPVAGVFETMTHGLRAAALGGGALGHPDRSHFRQRYAAIDP